MITRAESEKATKRKEAEGLAAAAVVQANQVAEAEGRKAQLLAEAEGERALAEARAANEKVNFEIEKLKIQTDAQIEIATSTAKIMANIGQNAEFINIGGGNLPGFNGKGGTGNVLLDTIMSLPGIMKVLNVENQALNGQSMTDEIKGLSDATFSGFSTSKKAIEDTSKDEDSTSKKAHEDTLEAEEN